MSIKGLGEFHFAKPKKIRKQKKGFIALNKVHIDTIEYGDSSTQLVLQPLDVRNQMMGTYLSMFFRKNGEVEIRVAKNLITKEKKPKQRYYSKVFEIKPKPVE